MREKMAPVLERLELMDDDTLAILSGTHHQEPILLKPLSASARALNRYMPLLTNRCLRVGRVSGASLNREGLPAVLSGIVEYAALVLLYRGYTTNRPAFSVCKYIDGQCLARQPFVMHFKSIFTARSGCPRSIK